MSEIELKKRKPTWDYMLNDLAFSSLKTRVLYGIFDNQDRFDFEYQIELKDKEIERLNNIINELEKMMKNDLECDCSMNENGLFNGAIDILEVYLDKLQELKENNIEFRKG